MIFVAFGHPKQEYWIEQMRILFPQALLMAVGGTFSTFSGVLPQPPLIMSRFGLEWLFRLIVEPHRIFRIWNAVVVFPFLWLHSLILAKK
jgi:N-acetylglucosaminyldiphosphoundecaprenol N-acetyl-beta-D-mannosaminyltransferase